MEPRQEGMGWLRDILVVVGMTAVLLVIESAALPMWQQRGAEVAVIVLAFGLLWLSQFDVGYASHSHPHDTTASYRLTSLRPKDTAISEVPCDPAIQPC